MGSGIFQQCCLCSLEQGQGTEKTDESVQKAVARCDHCLRLGRWVHRPLKQRVGLVVAARIRLDVLARFKKPDTDVAS